MNAIYTCCGTFLGIALFTALWFGWLHHKGQLIQEVPDDVKDLF